MSNGDAAVPLKVTFVTPKAVLGGAERWLLAILDATDRLAPHVIVQEDGPLVAQLHARGIPVDVVGTGASFTAVARSAWTMRRLLRRSDPDVVLANGIKPSLSVLPEAIGAGIPMCWVRHDMRFSDTLGRLIAKFADAVILVVPASTRERRRFDPVYLPPPLVTEPLDALAARKALIDLGVPDGTQKWLGMFTRLVPQKGIDVAIKSLVDAPSWRLVVAGTADPAEPGELLRLTELAAEVGVSQRVTWLGHVEAAGRLASAFDAIAVLTRPGGKGYPDTEGFPLSLIEAAAAGVPVIADPARVPPMALPDVAAGCLAVNAEDPASVSASLATLDDPVEYGRLALAMTELGRAHPRASQTASDLVDVLAATAFRPGAGLQGGPAMSIVSTVKNEGQHAVEMVERLLAQANSDDEIIVVDGGSDDETVPLLIHVSNRDSRVRLISAPGCGISEGRNIGISAAANEWAACTDAGCIPEPQWLASLRAASASGTAGLVTGTYRAGYGRRAAWEIALAHVAYPTPEELRRRTPLVRIYNRLFGRAYDATLPTGRSVAFSRQAWTAAGGFPENLQTAEDVMFGQNAVASGVEAVLSADACVLWEQRPTLRGNAKMFYRYGHGDGLSGQRMLVARDLARAAAYGAGSAMLLSRKTRPLALVGAAVYLSLPLKRCISGPRPMAAATMVGPVTAIRDLAKAAGCFAGLRERRQ